MAKVSVHLLREGQGEEVFRVEAPSRPGIFGVDVKPASNGPYRIRIDFEGEGITDSHELNLKEEAEEPEEISFLKEQQWVLEFGTAVVEERSLRADIRVPAEVTARSGGEAEVDAPLDGRLSLEAVPVIGAKVKAGQELARLILPTSAPSDLAGLELARREARTALDFARKDRARAERLVTGGAAPGKRLEEAAALEQSALARVEAAETRLRQYEASSRAEGEPSGSKLFVIRAPIAGVVQTVKTAPGANVKAGQMLFQIVDLDQVYVAAILPEAEYPRMRSLAGAELEVPGVEQPRRLTKLVTVGQVVDSPSRSFPVTYAVDNRDGRLAINQTVYVRIFSAEAVKAPTLPEAALVDGGLYVQSSGEGFVRRTVKLGRREAGMVQVLEGVKAGERVVTRGAHLIRLASMSSAVPAHGHVH
jgi:RND family efflux transporter MFP subunit